ncbi:MAG: DUF177 domain-containing protein [Mariprofundaceae bacterium]|nr:DUF177 domain-containing protein [Mariprofundaceae bacterium]
MSQQMYVHLPDIRKTGKTWQWEISPERLMSNEGSVDPLVGICATATWQGSIEYAHDIYTLNGSWKVPMLRQCVRCLSDFEWQSEHECQRKYSLVAPQDVDDEEKLDVEVIPISDRLNLMDVLREDIWLTWEACVICSSTCKGLCQTCGMDLNQGDCGCNALASSHPFAGLAAMKFDK